MTDDAGQIGLDFDIHAFTPIDMAPSILSTPVDAFSSLCQKLSRSPPATAVNINLVPVGRVGNPNNSVGLGQVNYLYHAGKFEVTNAEFAAFLNAIAALDDHHGIFKIEMETHLYRRHS